mgnify:FL=1
MSEGRKGWPSGESTDGYLTGSNSYTCPECSNKWNIKKTENDLFTVIDCNGNYLQNGDSVIVIKNLPVKGAPKPIKSGTKVKNIRLVDADHNINCKIDGFGSMQLKSEFVRRS